MAPQTGKTHAKHIQFFLDNNAGTLTELTAYTNAIGTVGLVYDEQEQTAYSDGVKNVVIGHPEAPLDIGGPFHTTLHTHMTAINGVMTPLSLDIRIGIRQAWEAGEPQFGISEDGSSGYVVTAYTWDLDAMTWSARLMPFGPTAPAWGTAAET